MNLKASLLVVMLFIGVNIVWYAVYVSEIEKKKYLETHICEQGRLIQLNAAISVKPEIKEFKRYCEAENLVCELKTGFLSVKYKEECPKSGRPYCSYTARVENGRVNTIESGYPCH